MDSRTEERVTDWDSRPLTDGYESLRELEDDEFSGVVEAHGTTLFMLNGKVVSVTSGGLDAFEDATGTIYAAPHQSLPLLFAMREQGGEERAKYYTNDTPISEADDTLSSGSFTGYIELSENVLSGDYYVVYYGGRSMSCAFVGNQEKLVTDDEAFERADDEVGIYTVWDVEIEVTEVPGRPDETETDPASAGAVEGDTTEAQRAAPDSATDAGADGAAGTGTGAAADTGADTATGASATQDPVDDVDPSDVDDGVPVRDAETAPDETNDDDVVARPPADTDARSDSDGAVDDGDADVETGVVAEAEPEADRPQRSGEKGTRNDRGTEQPQSRDSNREASGQRGQPSTTDDRGGTRRGGDSGSTDAVDDAEGSAMAEVPDEVMAEVESEAQSNEFAEEIAWRETTKIPSINPDRSTTTDESDDPLASGGSSTGQSPGGASNRTSGSSQGTGRQSGQSQQGSPDRQRTGGSDATEPNHAQRGSSQAGSAEPSESPQGASPGESRGAAPDTVAELESELESVRQERDSIASERDQLAAERDELEARNTELATRVEELESEITDLESELATMRERLENAGGTVSADAVELTEAEALEGTNLFVRYGSKSATTMEDVHDRDVTVADLEANLRLEYHTGFDAENAVVNGQPYEEFLYESIEYGFVEWFVYDLVFEIRDTGNEQALGDLYEAFPKVDRIELQGEVSLRYDQDGEEHREQSTFDVVVRDRMGNPLAVATVNDGREPATEDMMVDLQQRSERVKRTSDALAGALMVTSSYFNPGALEIADEATSGSLLSRDSKKSYVKLSRKQGYHLCLVETRNGEFHVNVPEL